MIFLYLCRASLCCGFSFSERSPCFFIFLLVALTFFQFSDINALALETGIPCNSFLVFCMYLQNSLYAVFLDGHQALVS